VRKHFDRLRLLTFALALGIATANTFAADHGEQAGKHWAGERGTSETTASIMARQQLEDAKNKGKPKKIKIKKEIEPPERELMAQNPSSPSVARWVPAQDSTATVDRATGPLTPQTAGVSFTGATLSDTSSFPPDTMGAVGPSQYIVFVNGRLRSFNKTTGATDGVLNADPDVFFSSVVNGSSTSDPRIRYDRLSGHWILIIINVPSTNNRVLLAVSDGATITGSTVWTFYFFNAATSTLFADYPTLGVDANALYIGANMFTTTAYAGTWGYVVRKSSVLSGGPIVVTTFSNLTGTATGPGPYTPQGVDYFDPAATVGKYRFFH